MVKELIALLLISTKIADYQEPLFTEDAVLWSLVWVIFGGTVLGLIGVRVATQRSHERRYQQYNAFREKF